MAVWRNGLAYQIVSLGVGVRFPTWSLFRECGVMGARVPRAHEEQFESDISDRGILSIGRLPGPYPGGVGSSPAPATRSKKKGNK